MTTSQKGEEIALTTSPMQGWKPYIMPPLWWQCVIL